MYVFFEVIKGIFLFFTVMVGILFLRGNIILGENSFWIAKQVIMPGYLIFCGLIIGYLIAHIWIGNDLDETNLLKNKIYVKSFIIGIILGIVLAITYIFI
ncbi:MAG: hypothetical protein WAZ12_03960 [Candidatus Absconditicoccaceae bacterium]